ncbi:MAG: helix-turn-helix transcriptional regulator [Ruminococcaceae bacterium]|nr:helix-turn-helix transcriptional regulator [Oscillospiraceae bacterium]
MPAQWTAEIIGEMHLNGVTHKRLAEAVGWHPKYLSAVLNGKKTPTGAESKIRSALRGIIPNAHTE